MGIAPLGQNIRLPDVALGKLHLKTGDIVSVSVIKPISSSVWAVGLKGIVLRARTDIQLTSGENLQAQVVKNGAHLELKLLKDAPGALQQMLQKAGFTPDALTSLIVSSLVKHQMKIEPKTVELIKHLIGKMKGDAKKSAQLAGLIASKGIVPDESSVPALAELLDYGAGEKEDKKRKEKRDSRESVPPAAEEVDAVLSAAMGITGTQPAGAMSLFNHLAPLSGDDSWIVAPFRIGPENDGLKGTLRLLYDYRARVIKKTVIVAHGEDGSCIQFSVVPGKGGFRMSVSSDCPSLAGAPLARWKENVEKLEKLGVHCDDSIKEDGADDGFERETNGPPYRSIDIEG
jgi:hypothetical protein